MDKVERKTESNYVASGLACDSVKKFLGNNLTNSPSLRKGQLLSVLMPIEQRGISR